MKKPEETKTSSEKTATQSAKPDNPAESVKKPAAKPGTLKSTETGAGDGSGARAGGGSVRPAESTLVGDGTKGRPAAAAKTSDATSSGISDGQAAAGAAPDKTDSRPLPEAQAPVPVQNVTVKKTGFWPVVLGGAVAAGLGAGAAMWALPHLPAGWLPAPPPPEIAQPAAPSVDAEAIRAEAVGAAEAAAAAQIEALRAELAAAAPVAAAPANGEGTSGAQAAALQAMIDEQAARLEEQAARIEELAARPVLDPEAAQRVQALADQAGALEQQISAAAEEAQSRIAAAQAEAQKLQEAAADSTRRAEAVAAVTALQAALDRGVTPDEARATLEGAGLEAPEALTREVPSLESLQAGFPEAARAALRVALREDSSGGGNALTNFLRAQTGARSVAPREGSDADAILSRADAAVGMGRIGAALDEVAALSEAARAAPAMADWLAGATAYRDAQAALSDLSANSN